MKTTLDLPDDLMRRVKRRAAQGNQHLQEAIAHFLEIGMTSADQRKIAVRPPKPVKLKQRRPLKIRDIESAIASGRA